MKPNSQRDYSENPPATTGNASTGEFLKNKKKKKKKKSNQNLSQSLVCFLVNYFFTKLISYKSDACSHCAQ